jgi:hypothetical protein
MAVSTAVCLAACAVGATVEMSGSLGASATAEVMGYDEVCLMDDHLAAMMVSLMAMKKV